MSLYTKTALKKIKKDELIQMFLDHQGKLNDIEMDLDGDGWLKQGYKTELSNSHKQQNRMVKEITKLKEERIELLDDKIKLLEEKKELLKENKKLKKDLEDTEYTRNYENKEWQKSYEKLEEEIEKLKENVMDEYGD
jgi:chromosome segregation ATPase